jgi:glutamyl/glutaminyl-tRNA synthetase
MLADSGNRETLRQVLQVVESSSEITIDAWPSFHAQLENRTGRKGKDLFAPFRAAVTGKTKGPELAKTLPLLGKERVVRRLKMALEL